MVAPVLEEEGRSACKGVVPDRPNPLSFNAPGFRGFLASHDDPINAVT
jgi:hypothetical protein